MHNRITFLVDFHVALENWINGIDSAFDDLSDKHRDMPHNAYSAAFGRCIRNALITIGERDPGSLADDVDGMYRALDSIRAAMLPQCDD